MNPFLSIASKKPTTKTSLCYVAAAALLLSAFTVLKPPTNFSGEWKLNEGKSELGQFPQFAPKKLKVAATDTSAAVERVSTGQDGQERSSKETLSYNGRETESTVFGTMKKKSAVKWSDDGKSMTVAGAILFERDGQSNEIKTTEVWKLFDDGKSLMVSSNSSSSFGDNAMKMVFDKVQ